MRGFISVALSVLVCGAAWAQVLTGRVSRVTDGDTFTLSAAKGATNVIVRLWGVDAPEARQAYGAKARAELAGLVTNAAVTVEVKSVDRYRRTVGRVSAGGADVGEEMVRRGAAWHSEMFAPGDAALAAAQREARDGRRGLWDSPREPVPPWLWRKRGPPEAGP